MAKKSNKKSKSVKSKASRRPLKKPVAKKPASKKSSRKKPAPKKAALKKAAPKKFVPKKAPSRPAASAAVAQPPPPPPPKPVPGSFIWHELASDDVATSKNFYAKLFGWKSEDREMMPGFIYTVFKHKGEEIAGMAQITPEQGDVKPRWDLYILVKDVDLTAQQAEALGGEVVIPPHDIPVGRWAALKDPTGAAIAIFKPAPRPRGS